ncbi:unnamed protein product [Rotaria sp. Silwood2]|nr:unnamed protein product [Rotaria sp. Silwood2]CAF4449536.1 unnamed protein product [Rotaria sp. Silwood2]
MREVYYLEGDLVIDTCACNDSSLIPASTLPTECLSPDGSSCDWYKNCLEREYSCQGTPTQHVLTYATAFCELYTKHKDIFSGQAQQWINDARKCLQMALVPFVRPFLNYNCQAIRDKAFTSYKPCYLRPYPEAASICHMTRRDWLRVFWTLKSAFIASTPIAYGSLQKAIDTFNECSMDTEANDFGHIFKEFKLTLDIIQTSVDNFNEDQSNQIAVRIAHSLAKIVLAPPTRWGWYAYEIPLLTLPSHTGYKQMAVELLVADLPGIVNETLIPPVNIKFFQLVHIYIIHHPNRDDTNNKLNSGLSKFTICMLFEETDTEESGNSLSDLSSLDNDFSKMQFESSSSEEEVTNDDDDDDVDLQVFG